MAPKLTRMTHKIAIQLHLVAVARLASVHHRVERFFPWG